MRVRRRVIGATVLLVTIALGVMPARPASAEASTGERVHTGSIGGADYRIEVPGRWNGVLLLYSHAYRPPGAANPATTTPDADMIDTRLRELLLGRGYALAGSSFATTGWAVEDALRDNVALVAKAKELIGSPRATIAWGASMGGLTSVLLAERNPKLVNGVLSLCGTLTRTSDLAGALDFGHTVKTFFAPDVLLANIPDGRANQLAAIAAMSTAASGTPADRARLVLATALANIPPQLNAHADQPVTDLDEATSHVIEMAFFKAFWAFGRGRVELEARAGGNPVGNVTADYRTVFARSSQRQLVERAYARAGLDLSADLARLNSAARVPAQPTATAYLARHGTPVGYQPVPTLTVHTTLDTSVAVEDARFFRDEVALFGRLRQLRQAYVARAGHCTFSPAEAAVAVDVLAARVRSGQWPATDPAALNTAAGAFPPADRQVFSWWPEPGSSVAMPPGFVRYEPQQPPRVIPL